jgi:hypothetical protein
MIPFDNNMLLMVAIILIAAATVYLFRDHEKTKSELNTLKAALSRPSFMPAPSTVKPSVAETKPETTKTEDESSD